MFNKFLLQTLTVYFIYTSMVPVTLDSAKCDLILIIIFEIEGK